MPRWEDEDVEVPASPEESKAVGNAIFDIDDEEDEPKKKPKTKTGTDSRTTTEAGGSDKGHPAESDDVEDDNTEDSDGSEDGHPSKKADGHPQQAEQLLAGRYKTVEDLVKGCNELASQLGLTIDWNQYLDKTVEDVVHLYKKLQTDFTKARTGQVSPDTSNTQPGQQQVQGYPAAQMQQQMNPQALFGQQAPGQQYPYQAMQPDPRDAEITRLRQQLQNMASYIVQTQQQTQQQQPQEEQITPEQFYEKLISEGPKAVNELLDKRLQQTLQPYIQQFVKLQQYVVNLERQRIAERNINAFVQMKQQEFQKFEQDYKDKITPEIAREMQNILKTNPRIVFEQNGFEYLYKLAKGSVAETSSTENLLLKKKMAAFIGGHRDAAHHTSPTEQDWLNKQFDLDD